MAIILQQNVGRQGTALVALMETARGRKADLVLVQEPPEFEGHRHPAYNFLRAGRVMAARRIDSDWTVTTDDSMVKETGGDVQVLSLGRRGHPGRGVRVVNAYFQGTGRETRGRGAERARWEDILSEDCILAGDFNAHSPLWNPRCTARRDAGFLEDLIRTYELVVKNDNQATRPASGCHSIIDLVLATPGASPFCEKWRTVSDPDHETGSDHIMIEWRWTMPAPKVDQGWKVRGWALRERLDKEKEEEWPPEKPRLEVLWRQLVENRPCLSDVVGDSVQQQPGNG